MHADPPEIHASHPIPVRQAGVLLSASFIKVVASLDLHDSLVLLRFGRTADFHRIDTRALPGAQTKTPVSFETGVLGMVSLTMSYFHWKYNQLSSAIRCFTVLFGMGRSGTTSLWSSGKGFAARAANSLLGQKQS